jgi:hypothetical protein
VEVCRNGDQLSECNGPYGPWSVTGGRSRTDQYNDLKYTHAMYTHTNQHHIRNATLRIRQYSSLACIDHASYMLD